jgi:exosome complex exonuclease DIS3/RRP44
VAEFTLRHFPACALLRRHPVPPPRQFEPLLRAAAAVGASIDPSTSKASLGGWRAGLGWAWRPAWHANC